MRVMVDTNVLIALLVFSSKKMNQMMERYAINQDKKSRIVDDPNSVNNPTYILVVNTFGMYGGKVLEKITHNEEPWLEARKGYGTSIPSSDLLSKERIKKYYIAVNEKYGIDKEDGIQSYICDIMSASEPTWNMIGERRFIFKS